MATYSTPRAGLITREMSEKEAYDFVRDNEVYMHE